MASSAADGYGGGEEQYMYHVPQQSRREKLRYHPHDDPSSSSSSSFHLIHPPNPNPAPPFHHTAHFFPSSSPSQNPSKNYAFCTGAATAHQQHPLFAHQISSQQQFSLSLAAPPPPPPRQQHVVVVGAEGGPAPLGPFTGYAEILIRSRFLEPARQLLEEIGNVGGLVQCSDPAEAEAEAAAVEGMMTGGRMMEGGQMMVGCGGGEEQHQWKKTRLISMLDEVYRRYKVYYQQVQAVITSFESVPGLGSAAPYASMTLKVMSKHFRCLKNSISDQLQHINKAIGKEGFGEEENPGFGLINRLGNNYGTIRQPHVWRPQRGLPERAVAVLRAWLFEHFLHPYPTDTDKQMLAKQTGLTRNQVSNWFINARVRLWKPMVEEIHSLEMRQQNKAGAGDTNHNTDKQAQLPSSSTATSSNDPPFHNTNQNSHNQSSKRHHDELKQMPNHIQEPNYNLLYDGFSGHHNIGVGGGMDVKGNGGVSLTLGLHQNNGICLAEPIPLNVVRRFGLDLEECSDPYVIGSFGVQDRQFDKDIGGHLLHDFVG